ncbi:hypothetical protein ACS5PN_09795 [Roseateles sp. NT4]|uniref:hypothetical protein n=1 Tax=Roseateles sp. NT4 TaxID=3453715 RepID=UPI003EEAFE69
MVGAIGGVSPVGSGGRSIVASPELAVLRKQLADCVNCESAKTQSGQTQIAQLSARVAAVKEQLQNTGASATPPASPPASPPSLSTPGNLLDVYA